MPLSLEAEIMPKQGSTVNIDELSWAALWSLKGRE
jgi:hypothetical protein